MLARTALTSTMRLSIQIEPSESIATKIEALSFRSAVTAPGLFTSMPASFTNDAVTMKKISMMNDMSMIGVRSMLASSSVAALLLRPIASSSVDHQQVVDPAPLLLRPPAQPDPEEHPRESRDQSGHGGDGRLRHTRGHRANVAVPRHRDRMKDLEHAEHRPEQAEERTDAHQRRNDVAPSARARRSARDQQLPDLSRVP